MSSARHGREGERSAQSAMSNTTEGPDRMRTEERLLGLTIRSLMTLGGEGACRKQAEQ